MCSLSRYVNHGRCGFALVGTVLMFFLFAVPAGAQRLNQRLELVDLLIKGLNVTAPQARGGAGALLILAKTRLNPDEFESIAATVPSLDVLLKSVPEVEYSVWSSRFERQFKSLGLSPDMASKFAPILIKFVSDKGGADIGSLLAGALKEF